MSYTIVYEVIGETGTVRRDEYHTDSEPLLTAYNEDDGEITAKVHIPIERVVRIDAR